MMKNKKAMPVAGNGEKGDVMERGFVRIIMAVIFSVFIAIFLSSCGDCNGTCGNDNSDTENENGDDNGGEESPVLPGVRTLVSVDSNGNEANNSSYYSALSADGRYVAFDSSASNLVANDTNNNTDIFLHDRQNGTTTRVSVDSNGNEGNNGSYGPAISADGRYVAFDSSATNLVPDDNNGTYDVFVHDCLNGLTTRVSVGSSGNQGNNISLSPAISADGRYVTFSSKASNLVPNDNNGYNDVFVHDLQSGETTRVSVDTNGNEGNSYSSYSSYITSSNPPPISADGRYVAFESTATNLVPNDNNGYNDVFVHDRHSGETTRVSVDSNGNEANGDSYYPVISADGRYVAFLSKASNLMANDTDGYSDVFVHDRLSGETTLISVDSNGNNYGGDHKHPAISADGRYVSFSVYGDIFIAPIP